MWAKKRSILTIVVFATLAAIVGLPPAPVSAASDLSSLTLTPTSVVGGIPAQGKVTLTGVAPWGGATVTLTSSNPSVATVPSTVRVWFGFRTATFTVTTKPVSDPVPVSVNIAASYKGVTKTATLTITPVSPAPTSTPTATNTPTPLPPTTTNTATATSTATPLPPTSTSTPTATNTPTPLAPTATNTATSTSTPTPLPPTSTSTPTATNTPLPPISTNTPTVTKTPTPLPPTATNTPASTSTATATKTPTPGGAGPYVWNSYDAVVVSTSFSGATIPDSTTATLPAQVSLFRSVNSSGVDYGSPLPSYRPGTHAELFNNLAAGYWAGADFPGYDYPYFGKSGVGRGSGTMESNAPQPLGVRDFQMHPPYFDQLLVASFAAPVAGDYTVSSLGVRRVYNEGGPVRLKVFDQNKALLADLQATNNRAWVTNSSTYNLGRLNPGDLIYFAVDKDGDFGWDATEVVFTVTATNTGTTVPTMTVDDPPDYRVFQRDIGGTSKSVAIGGTYANLDWSRVEARVLRHGTETIVVDWTTIDSTPGEGRFAGHITAPQGGWYNLEIRAIDGAGSVIGSSRGTHKWGVGMIILAIGQSNMSGHAAPPFTVATSDLAVNYSNAGVWEHVADPYDDDSPPGAVDSDNDEIASHNVGGSMIPALANSLWQTFSFPIAFVPSAKGGSNLYSEWAYRNSADPYVTSTLYGQSITKAQSVGGVELIIMHQGEQDGHDRRTEAQYEADFATMIGHYRLDLYPAIPIFICQLGTADPVEIGDAYIVAIRNAQHDLDNGTNIFLGATAMDQLRGDEVHYTVSGLNVIGNRLAQAIKFYLGAATYYRGPAITTVTFTDGTRTAVDVQIVHRRGSDIVPASGITGFSLLVNGSPVGITSAARVSADRIRLTLPAAVPLGTTVKLRYLWGATPNTSGLVKDNSPMALPLENTTADITVG